MDKKNLTVLVIVAILFFVVGGGLGIAYQIKKDSLTPKEKVQVESANKLSSKVIPSITAFGEVSNITGKNITLTFGGDSLVIKIRDDAQIYLPATNSTDKNGKAVALPQRAAKFSDIKTGDSLSINLKLLPDGQIEGQMVIIINSK